MSSPLGEASEHPSSAATSSVQLPNVALLSRLKRWQPADAAVLAAGRRAV
jgi:hypothetical protein